MLWARHGCRSGGVGVGVAVGVGRGAAVPVEAVPVGAADAAAGAPAPVAAGAAEVPDGTPGTALPPGFGAVGEGDAEGTAGQLGRPSRARRSMARPIGICTMRR